MKFLFLKETIMNHIDFSNTVWETWGIPIIFKWAKMVILFPFLEGLTDVVKDFIQILNKPYEKFGVNLSEQKMF